MKAAVIMQAGQPPEYRDFAPPSPLAGEHLITVTAAAMSHVVKSRASGTHYSSSGQAAFIAGIDGVGRLADGSRVYFLLPRAPYGSMAQSAAAPAAQCVPLPDGLDDVTAAAIANPGVSSWAAYTLRARLRAGETVLINGATGTAGRLAVQIAKYLGAKKVIATGRNSDALQALKALGADVILPLADGERDVDDSFRQQFAAGVDVVIDYLWGRSAERLLTAAARAGVGARPVRFVQIGAAGGPDISLPGAVLRSSAIELMGSGIGSIALDRLVSAAGELLHATLPGGFAIAATPVPLSEVEQAWPRDDSTRRTVFTVAPKTS
ncbi:quinone oxidoreductase family protein [Sodalis sp. RH21]|uniref:quinone oxidoreductase family protein n=1 Tax=unclassified Sodalis (in: enterobacteria) TaxID=2636512 RepID=UPI0039B694AA